MTDYERTIFCMNICPQGAYCFNEIIANNIAAFLFEYSFVASGLIDIQN